MLAAVFLLLATATDPLVERLLAYPAFPRTLAAKAESTRPQPDRLTGEETLDDLQLLALTKSPLMTSAVRTALMQRLVTEPNLLPRVIEFLPETPEGAAAAWAAFQKVPAAERNAPGYERVHEWLRQHGYLRAELDAAIKSVHDQNGYVTKQADLNALARLDWASAKPLLQRLAAGSEPRAAALAHALLYRYGETKDAERAILKSIAEDQKAPAHARDIAIDTLMSDDWEGRDDWYFARFEDATLAGARDGYQMLTPLIHPVWTNPDAWIPRIAPLAASANKVVRTNAAAILGDFCLERARADALQPLLPWLAHPRWADDVSMHRLRLIQSVAKLGLRDAIPGLQWICGNDPSDTNRVYAADALVEFHAPDAMTYARKVLDTSKSLNRGELEATIAREAALSDEEIVEVVIAYAAAISSPEGVRKLNESMMDGSGNWRATLGMRYAEKPPPREELAQTLIAAAGRPGDASAVLGRIVSRMNVPTAHRWAASRLPSLAADDALVAISLLEHRIDAAKHASTELHAALAGSGAGRGIAAVVLGDAEAIHAVLESGSPEARQGLFAAARLVREPLKVHDVVAGSKGAETAADALLETLNTSETRAALASLHPGEAAIWGERPWADPGHTTFQYFDEWEKQLRALAKKGRYDWIYALSVASYWGGNHEVALLGERGDALSLIRGASATPLASAVTARVRALFAAVKPDDLPIYEMGAADGAQFEFVSLTANGGHRLFMNNPPSDKRDPYGRLVSELSELFDPKR